MEYKDYNISGSVTDGAVLINNHKSLSSSPYNVTVYKCSIVNTYSANITVDVYLEHFNEEETNKLYGTEENNADRERVTQIFYKAKGLVIPAGVSVDIFDSTSCVYNSRYSFKIKLSAAAETADVSISYETGSSTRGTRQNINQY